MLEKGALAWVRRYLYLAKYSALEIPKKLLGSSPDANAFRSEMMDSDVNVYEQDTWHY